MNTKKHKIIDGDGHVVEDHSAITARMPQQLSRTVRLGARPLSAQRSPACRQRAYVTAGRFRQSRPRGLDRFHGRRRSHQRRALPDQRFVLRPRRQLGLGHRAGPRLQRLDARRISEQELTAFRRWD